MEGRLEVRRGPGNETALALVSGHEPAWPEVQRQPGPWAGHDENIASKVWGRRKSGAPREARPPPSGAGSLRQVLLVSKQTRNISVQKHPSVSM